MEITGHLGKKTFDLVGVGEVVVVRRAAELHCNEICVTNEVEKESIEYSSKKRGFRKEKGKIGYYYKEM